MARKHRKEHHEEHVDESWLVPYADILTLLLALFIVLFASAQVDQKKLDVLAQSFSAAFQTGGASGTGNNADAILQNVRTVPQHMTDGQTKPAGMDDANNPARRETTAQMQESIFRPDASYIQETLQMVETKKALEEYMKNNGLSDQIEVTLSENGLIVRINDSALFESGRADLLPSSLAFAAALGKMLSPSPQKVSVSGHTDNMPINTPEFPSNWDLSTRRALNFMKFLLANGMGEKPERFSVSGHGEHHPIASNTTPEGRAKNRRVEILVLRSHPAT